MTTTTTGTEPAADATPPRRRRGALFWVGALMVLVGLGLLGYVGWQMYGTNVVSQQTHQKLVEEAEQEWTVAEGAQVGREPRNAPAGTVTAVIRIPRFGDGYAVPVVEGIRDEDLSRGYGHFRKSAVPGQKGNYALAAHRVTHGEPLRDMPELRPGDEVIVETERAVYTYVLDTDPNDLVVTFRDTWVVDPLPTNPDGSVQPQQRKGQRLITLTTCSELFNTDNRMIAFGHLQDVAPKGGSVESGA